MPRSVRRGEIFEISTPKGLAYFQVTHRDRSHGYLIRVIDGLFQTPPSLNDLLQTGTKFLTFFPVSQALTEGVIRLFARSSVPQPPDPFPIMKVPGLRDRSGRVEKWWLWNGVEEWPVDALTAYQAQYPTAAVLNDTLLIARIMSGWKHEDDVT